MSDEPAIDHYVAGRMFDEEYGDFLSIPFECIAISEGEIDLVETLLNAGPLTTINYGNLSEHTVGSMETANKVFDAHAAIVIHYYEDSRYYFDFDHRFRRLNDVILERRIASNGD